MRSLNILLLIISSYIFSCSVKQETKSISKINQYLNSLDSLKTPIVFNTDKEQTNLSEKFDSTLFIKFKNRWAYRPLGKLFETDSIAVTIDLTAGDIITPIVMTYDLDGHKLDSMNLYTYAGRDLGYECNERVTINNKREITTIRSTRRWELQGNTPIDGTDKLTVDTTTFKINKQGKILFVSTSAENSNEFLSLFKDIDPVGLHIYTNRSEGIPIEVRKYKYVNVPNMFVNIEACRAGRSNIYAIGKFEINENYLGLITRQHSQYDESLVQLLLWDKQQKRIREGIDLADGFGDEGWYFDQESWIKDYQFKKELKIITWRKDSEADENFKRTKVKDSLTMSNFNLSTFETTSLEKKDTMGYHLKNWK